MQIYPEKYDKLGLSTSEKSFLRTLDRAFPDGQLAYYVLHINPRKKTVGQGTPELFNLLIVPEGIVLLRFFELNDPLAAAHTIKALSSTSVFKMLLDYVCSIESMEFIFDISKPSSPAKIVCFSSERQAIFVVISTVCGLWEKSGENGLTPYKII